MQDNNQKEELEKEINVPQINMWRKVANIVLRIIDKDFTKFSAILAAIVTIGIWGAKSFWYFYQMGKLSIYGIDKSYISTNNENVVFQIIQLLAIVIILVCSNYLYYQFSIVHYTGIFKVKKYGKKLLLWLGECIIIILIVSTQIRYDLIEMIEEIRTYNSAEILQIIINIWITYIIVNLIGIEFAIQYKVKKVMYKIRPIVHKVQIWYKKRCIRNKNNDKVEDNKKDEKNVRKKTKREYQSVMMACMMVLVTVSIELFFVYFISAKNESSRADYKVILEDADYSKNNEYVFWISENKATKIYPVVYENKNIYILSRLYNVENSVKIDYDYQKVIGKENVETQRIEDIYSINITD